MAFPRLLHGFLCWMEDLVPAAQRNMAAGKHRSSMLGRFIVTSTNRGADHSSMSSADTGGCHNAGLAGSSAEPVVWLVARVGGVAPLTGLLLRRKAHLLTLREHQG